MHDLITAARESDSLICVSQSTDPLPTDITTLQPLLAQARAERDVALAERDHLQSQNDASASAAPIAARAIWPPLGEARFGLLAFSPELNGAVDYATSRGEELNSFIDDITSWSFTRAHYPA